MTNHEGERDWWRLYDDPLLDALIQEAFTKNNELKSGLANLRAVRASVSEARAARLPATSVNAQIQHNRVENDALVNAPDARGDSRFDTYGSSFQAAYEVDLFGRVAANIRVATSTANAAQAALAVVRVTVAAETTRAYADVCSANAQIAVAQRTLELQRRTAALTQALKDSGGGTVLAVASARAAASQTESTIPPLRAARNAALFRLATLTGAPPAEVNQAAAACRRPPQLVQPIPIGDGASLLARRPDVRQAAANLAAASARAKVATASLYPQIKLGGAIGTSGFDSSGLGADRSFRFSFGPLITWSFPNVLAARAQIRAANARSDAALAVFDQTVLTALQETETALSDYANELDRRASLIEVRDEAARAATFARQRFEGGAETFLTVLDAERTQAGAEAAVAASDALVTAYQIALFRALGGGWQEAS